MGLGRAPVQLAVVRPSGRRPEQIAAEGEYEEYHSSADDLDLVPARATRRGADAVLAIIDLLESDQYYSNLAPKGNPSSVEEPL